MAKASVKKVKKQTTKEEKVSKFASLALFFFDRPKLSLSLWAGLLVAGVLSFTVLLPKEGFPQIQLPVGVATGTYFVDDAERVDTDIAQEIAKAVEDTPQIKQVDTIASDNFFQVVATYTDEQTSASGNEILQNTIEEAGFLPKNAQIDYLVIDPGKYLNKYDALISVYAKEGQSAEELQKIAQTVADSLSQPDEIVLSEVVSQFDEGVNPFTGEKVVQQTSFGGVGLKDGDGNLEYYRSTTVGVARADNIDIIELSGVINEEVTKIAQDEAFESVGVVVGADFADSINTQIDGLMQNLLTGLIAVAIISFLLITWRASIITALFMVTVIMASMFVLHLVGFSLNTITLFALVLSLGLFVDDSTIIVEAIDAGKKNSKSAREAVKGSITKVASASFAGTMTTVLVFLPLAFITGVLGEFIYIMPITVIIALVSSLFLSLTLIPFLSKSILLKDIKDKKKLGTNPIAKAEAWTARCLSNFINLTKKNRLNRYGITFGMIGVSLFFLFASGALAGQLKFNIFPETKDSDQLNVSIVYPQGTDIEQAQVAAMEIGDIVDETIGEQVVRINFGAFSPASERSSDALIELVPYTERGPKAPALIEELEQALMTYDGAQTRIVQAGAGPPPEQYPFKVQIFEEDTKVAASAAADIEEFLNGSTVTRPNGTTANITDTSVGYVREVARRDGKQFVQVEAGFDDSDVTTLVISAQELVEAEYGDDEIAALGLEEGSVEFNFGFESESQDSFSSLLIIGPIALLAMFILLAMQFRSLIQPLLIFVAVPFSFFGVMLGLNLTDNPISFFTMIGFFGLIGISVNNTILMTDYANQERRQGKRIIDSISEAARKRFRPLLTTSLTTVAALTPLALSDPFWEGLAFTIIFGLLSSTFFVLISFPFYYLVVEGARTRTKDKWKEWRAS